MKIFSEEMQTEIDKFREANNCWGGDIEFYVFPQTWGSTSMGYGGIGGQAMTSAPTLVVYCTLTNKAMVSFGGGRFIYIKNCSSRFFEDISKSRLCSVSNFYIYERDCHYQS